MHSLGTLAVFPNLRTHVREDGLVVLTEKFITGVKSYLDYWDGPVVLLIEPSPEPSNNLDNVIVDPRDLPFGLDVTSYDAIDLRAKLSNCAAVQGGVSCRQNHLSRLCQGVEVPFVYGTEYTLKTRVQIIRVEDRNPIVRAKRIAWEWNQERQTRVAIQHASGIQCNGVPTYNAYRELNSNALLFFDNRVRAASLIDEEVLEKRLARLRRGEQLRLAFSGRLNNIKGADHLIALACVLKARSVPFELVICGGGPLEDELRARIDSENLKELVEIRGVMSFENELLPFVRQNIDLFVCCHRQGDPSCTYLETFACGVPIVGYDNEAFAGLLEYVDAGECVAIDNIEALADSVQKLATQRDVIEQWSRNALEFARKNTFERVFRARINQLRELAGLRSGKSAG